MLSVKISWTWNPMVFSGLDWLCFFPQLHICLLRAPVTCRRFLSPILKAVIFPDFPLKFLVCLLLSPSVMSFASGGWGLFMCLLICLNNVFYSIGFPLWKSSKLVETKTSALHPYFRECPESFLSFFFFFLSWSIIALQYSVTLCCTTPYTYTHIFPLSWTSLPPTPYHSSRSSQSTEMSSLWNTAPSTLVIYFTYSCM